MDVPQENENIVPEDIQDNRSPVINDETKLADLTVGQFKQLLADWLAQTPPVNTMPAPTYDHAQPEITPAAPEPPRKLSLEELFLDENPVPQSPTTDTGSDS